MRVQLLPLNAAGFAIVLRRVPSIMVLALLGVCVLCTLTASAADPTPPADGGGIKWSTLTKKMVTVNGQQQQAMWDPYRNGVKFLGYEVELTQEVTVNGVKTKKISVWFLPGDPPMGFTQQEWDDLKYWCHGRTFDDTVLSPGGEAVPFILAAGWKRKACFRQTGASNLAAGDVISYYLFHQKLQMYIVAHTAKSNGNGTFTSKNRDESLMNMATVAQMDALYLGTRFYRYCYTPK